MRKLAVVLGTSHRRAHREEEDCPWILGDETSACGKLVRYLSGGGMRTFGRTLRQDQVRRYQNRFFAIAAVLGALWLLFMFV